MYLGLNYYVVGHTVKGLQWDPPAATRETGELSGHFIAKTSGLRGGCSLFGYSQVVNPPLTLSAWNCTLCTSHVQQKTPRKLNGLCCMQSALEPQRVSVWQLPLLPQFLFGLGPDTQGAAWHCLSALQLTSGRTGIAEKKKKRFSSRKCSTHRMNFQECMDFN